MSFYLSRACIFKNVSIASVYFPGDNCILFDFPGVPGPPFIEVCNDEALFCATADEEPFPLLFRLG